MQFRAKIPTSGSFPDDIANWELGKPNFPVLMDLLTIITVYLAGRLCRGSSGPVVEGLRREESSALVHELSLSQLIFAE